MLSAKLFGSFRWLAFLLGAALISVISWVLWPDFAQNVPKTVVKTSETTRIASDSAGMQALRDSLSMMQTRTASVRVVRITVRDTVRGTETVYLDSGAVVRDTVSLVRTVSDTVRVRVTDTLYVERSSEPVAARDDWAVVGGIEASHGADLSGMPVFRVSARLERRIWGPAWIGLGVKENVSSLKGDVLGGLSADAGVFVRIGF